jgi:hypothetical protein
VLRRRWALTSELGKGGRVRLAKDQGPTVGKKGIACGRVQVGKGGQASLDGGVGG